MSKFNEVISAAAALGINPQDEAVATEKRGGRPPISNEVLLERWNSNPDSVNPAQRKRLIEAGMIAIEPVKRGPAAKPIEEVFKEFVLDPENVSISYRNRLIEAGMIEHVPATWTVTAEHKSKVGLIKAAAKKREAAAAKAASKAAETSHPVEASQEAEAA